MPSNNGRRTTLDEIGDIHAPKGSREWCIAIVGETKKTLSVLKNDATSAGARLRALREVKAWKALGLVGWSVLLSTIGLTDNEAESLIKAKRGQTIGDIVPLAKHGGDRKGQPEQVDNIKLHAGGTGSDYLLRRPGWHPRPPPPGGRKPWVSPTPETSFVTAGHGGLL